MFLKAFRIGAGYLIVLFDWISRPKPQQRTDAQQEHVQQAINGHSLYQLYACPFCVKTRRALHKLNLKMELRDVGTNQEYRKQLESGGGRIKVPCLRIENEEQVRWMYESKEIISYLESRVTRDDSEARISG